MIQITTALDILAPSTALALIVLDANGAVGWVYPIIFVIVGMVEGSIMLGFLNFVLEIAPADSRPTYMGLTNTLAGLLVVMPILGGWVLERTSYPILFGLAGVGSAIAAVVALTLPNPRRKVAVTV